MEPPSSVNNQTITAGSPADDPLSNLFTSESYLIVSSFPGENEEDGFVVCGYSPRTGTLYLGTSGPIKS